MNMIVPRLDKARYYMRRVIQLKISACILLTRGTSAMQNKCTGGRYEIHTEDNFHVIVTCDYFWKIIEPT
jgi:hypothetical protein